MTTQPDDSTAAAMADDIVTTLCTENYLHIGFFDGNADIGHAIGFIKRGRWIYILDPNQYCISTTSTKDLKTLIGDSEFCEQGSGVYYKWVIKKREGGSFDKYYL
ncbi:hypothetical protein [Desulfosarcina cetonica]|uniref:hypothetical protein n=1 Tax=Desulfosarcina cetonica TaxID=90730 RepID=UPI0006D1FA65|nr:hypothetical protein [Desulfosarcina cetonica]